MTTIGFDVSKSEFIGVRVDRRGRSAETYQLPSTAAAIRSLLDSLTGTHRRLLLAAEATAEHHRTLAFACFERKIPFRILNPITTKQFTRATVRKKKTDLSDALIVARIALQGEGTLVDAYSFSRLQPIARTSVKLSQMVHMLTLMEQRITRLFPDDSAFLDCVRAPHQTLTESIRALRLRTATDADPELSRLLGSIPGIGPTIAGMLIAEIGTIDRFSSGKSLVAYSGLDPKVRQSGTSIKRNTRLTKQGSPYLRRAIYIAATIAQRWDPELRDYFAKKRNEGKRYREATVAVSRKLLYRVYAVWKRGTPYIRNSHASLT